MSAGGSRVESREPPPELVDSHVHLDFEAYDDDRQTVLERARRVGVTRCFVPGTRRASWHALGRLREEAGVVVGVGQHPWFLHEEARVSRDELSAAAAEVAARMIGECGIDGPTARSGKSSLDAQRAALDEHLEAARSLGLPLCLHVVHGHRVALEALRSRPVQAGVVHAFTGPPELAREYRDLGFKLGIGAVLLGPAKRIRATVASCPLDSLVLETDGPGRPGSKDRLEPGLVADIAVEVARIRGESLATVARVTTQAADELLGACDVSRSERPRCH